MKQVAGIWLPDWDKHFTEALAKSERVDNKGTYQLKKIQRALALIPKHQRKTALDIGAHVGLWSMILRKNFDRVAAFEPHPELIACFCKNLDGSLWPEGNVLLYQFALGNESGQVKLKVTEGNSGNCHIVKNQDNAVNATEHGLGDTEIEVQMHTLDSAFADEVSFIKIDVEGYEIEVLRGAERTIRTQKPYLLIEQKPGNAERYGYKRMAAVDLACKWGMNVKWEIAGDYFLAWR